MCATIVAIIERVREVETPPYRPELNLVKSDMHPKIESIMQRCWAENPCDRPSFDEVNRIVKSINKGK